MRIIIDLDDTIHDLVNPWTEELSRKYGVPKVTVKEWDICAHYPTLTKQQIFSPLSDPNFWKMVKPRPGAIENIRKMIADGDDVIICTATNFLSAHFKFQSTIFSYFPDFNRNNIIIAHRKDLINGDIIIDDGPHNMNFLGYKILFSANHNKNVDAEDYGAIRCIDWDDAYLKVQEFKEASRHRNKIYNFFKKKKYMKGN